MILMSLDLSTKASGVAIFEDKKLKYYECIKASDKDPLDRITKMVSRLGELYREYEPDNIIIEDVIPDDVGNNHTFKLLHYLQAFVVMLFHKYNKTPEFYTASEWRKKCGIRTGRHNKRDSLKIMDMEFAKKNFGVDAGDDIADAICIGAAYLNIGTPIDPPKEIEMIQF